MIQRRAANVVRERLERSPAVGLIGPRQGGKTTLARSFEGKYPDMEVESDRRVLVARVDESLDSEGLLVTNLPGLLTKLREFADETR